MSPSVTFQSDGQQPARREVTLEGRHSLLTFARLAGLLVPAICGAHGTCGKCKLRVVGGAPPGPDPVEDRLLGQQELAEGWRLSCRLYAEGDLVVAMPPERPHAGPRKVATTLTAGPSELEPAVVAVPLPRAAGVAEAFVDEDSLFAVLGRPARSATLAALRGLGEVRCGKTGEDGREKKPWAVMRGSSVIQVLLKPTKPRVLGVAIDIGTTTLAAYLVDLETGEELAAASAPNDQAGFGADVISRADYALHGHMAELQDAVLSGINGLIAQLCALAAASPREIYEATLAGNSCMHHLLLGLQVDGLAKAPYVPVLRRPLVLDAAALKLDLNHEANVYCFPLIGGFVGGDIVADLLATRLYQGDRPRLLIDFGTNAEIVLGCRAGMVACSAAAGPAFEGGRIRCGIGATDGAIAGVEIVDGHLRITTVGDAPAAGIAGSGLVDAMAALHREGIVDAYGLYRDHPLVARGEHGKRVVLASGCRAAGRAPIVLTEEDIVEFQLARAAIRAGVEVLIRELGIGLGDVAEVLVAGAFGSALRLQNAQSIGLIPTLAGGGATSAGNAAGVGAQLALVSVAQRRAAARVAAAVRYVELAGRPDFADAFARHLLFA